MSVVLDPTRMAVSAQGVAGFVWPVSRAELVAVRDAYLAAVMPFLRSESRNNRQAAVFGVMTQFLGDVLAVYKAQAIVRRLRARGFEPVVAQNSPLLGAMLAGRAPPLSGLVRMLEKGVAQPAAWRRAARLIREVAAPAAIAMPRLASLDLTRDIVTVAVGDMIWQHAAAIGEKVSFVRFEEWFAPLTAGEGAHYGGPPGPGLLDAMMDIVRTAFAAGNEPLLEPGARYLRDLMLRAGSSADRHLGRLLRTPERIPRRLWRGTGGHVWSRLISHAVRELGGQVTGHDHAHGMGMFETYHDTIIEHPGCSRFMVLTPMQREMALRNLRADLVVGEAPPEIAVVPGTFRPKIPGGARGSGAPGGGRPMVMYVGTIYDDERAPFTPSSSDIARIDWEARLIAKLRDWGYDVIVKPHPESKFPPPSAYETVLGARIMNEAFEQVYDRADILLFGQANCTPFFGAIGTSQPIVMLDRGRHAWQPEAKELVARRCAYVPCRTDADNRIHFDPTDLREALRAAPSRHDDGLYRAFLHG